VVTLLYPFDMVVSGAEVLPRPEKTNSMLDSKNAQTPCMSLHAISIVSNRVRGGSLAYAVDASSRLDRGCPPVLDEGKCKIRSTLIRGSSQLSGPG
jgi:hypothetical protein